MVKETKKVLILIADDEADFREILKIKLESVGFSIIEASNGREALEVLKTAKPDIILIDVVMPEMGGIEALLKIKSDDAMKGIRVIVLTGKGDPREEITRINQKFAQESGAFDYVRKEIDLDQLVEKINYILTEDGKL